MIKKRKIIFSLLLIVSLTFLIIFHEISSKVKTSISMVVNSVNYMTVNEDANLDTTEGLTLVEKNANISVSGINVDKDSVEVRVGKSEVVNVTILPENAANKNFTVTSLDESIAYFEGTSIFGVSPGKTTIKFNSVDGNYEDTVEVSVIQPLENISLNKSSGTIFIRNEEKLTVSYNPVDTTDDKTVIWSSSHNGIATVYDGVVKAISPGTSTITAKVGDKTATFVVTVSFAYSKGDGTKNNPYIINTSEDLYYVRDNLSAYYELGNDLDLTEETRGDDALFNKNSNGWDPISQTEFFTGTFDGKGYKIKGIYQRIVTNDVNIASSTGLFGKIKGTIKNLIIEDFKFNYANLSKTEQRHIGSLGTYIVDSTLENISVSGDFEMTYGTIYDEGLYIGGIAGKIQNSTLINVTNYLNLNLGLKYLFASGGVASEIEDSTLSNVTNYGNIEGNSAGGISNTLMDSNVTNVKNYGTINARQGGGIALQFSGSKMRYGSNYGALNMITNGNGGLIGGLVGMLGESINPEKSQEALIEQSFNAGLINVVLSKKDGSIGGIVGSTLGNKDDGTKPVTIKNCYNIGELMIKNPTVYSTIGGIAGNFSAHIENSYNVGNIKLDNPSDIYYVNELVGSVTRMISDNSAGSIDNSYYVEKGFNAYAGPGILLNTKALSFNNAINKNSYVGFDFDNIWEFNNNYPFPQLKFNLLEGEYINSITINNEETNILSKQDYQLIYSLNPNKFTNNDLIFEIIEGNDLATIDQNGKMNLIGKGKIKVKVSSKKINSIYSIKEFNLLIIKDLSELTILDINDLNYDGKEKKPEVLMYDGDYKLTSDDYEVTYSNNINPGEATITIKGKLNYKGTIVKKFNIVNPLENISLNKSSSIKKIGEIETLIVTYNPANTTDVKTIKWTTSDNKIATVDNNGNVKAIAPGKATITATVGNKTATYVIDVKSPLVRISLNKTSGQLNVGQEQDLVVTYNPSNTTDSKTVIWTTSDNKIATVNNGKVKAIAPGKVTITAKVGEKLATYNLEVKLPLVSISLNKTSGQLNVIQEQDLVVTYNPSNTTDNKTVIWTTSDNKIATVNNGKVKAIAPGNITITAKVGDKIATYKLTVIAKETLQNSLVTKGFKIKNNFVHGFKLGDSLISIKNKIGLNYTSIGSNTLIATGIQFKYNSELFTVVVYGDLNGDGKINSADLLKMRQHLLGTSVLNGVYKEAGSIATGTTINSADLLRIRQHLLGQKSINQ